MCVCANDASTFFSLGYKIQQTDKTKIFKTKTEFQTHLLPILDALRLPGA